MRPYHGCARSLAAPIFAKSAFSLSDDQKIRHYLAEQGKETIILAGLEAHVCVLSTVDDLLRRQYRVVVAADAIASRDEQARRDAIATMRALGASVVPTESILFRLQRDAAAETFRALSKIVK